MKIEPMVPQGTLHLAAPPKRTLAARASHELRRAILTGALRPGKRLRLQQLAGTFDLSMSTLREALLRLTADGLVVLEDQRGFAVASVSRKQLHDLLEMRLLLEERGLRLAIAHGDTQWEARIVAAFHRLSRASEAKSDPRIRDENWEDCHADFHRALILGGRSPLLLQMWDMVYSQGDRYRHLYRQYAARKRDHIAEHRQIMDAMLHRRPDRAVELIQDHLRATVKALLARVELDRLGMPKATAKSPSRGSRPLRKSRSSARRG